MKFDIFNRFSGKLQFTAEIECPDTERTGWKLRLALEWALINKVSLNGAVFDYADLSSFDGASFVGASFDGASFVGASFDGASFVGASFVGASFDGASFDGASFDGASFDGASFDGASFDGASFDGASFKDCIGSWGEKLVGEAPIITIGPVGSRKAPLVAESYQDGVWVRTGCWPQEDEDTGEKDGSLEAFKQAVDEEHGDNRHGDEYRALIEFLRVWGQCQRDETPTVETVSKEVAA